MNAHTQQFNQPPHPNGTAARHGRLFIVSAPSGAGKTTLCNAVLEKLPALSYSISHTTRPPRPGEQDGVDYFFISEQEFKKNIDNHVWAEYARIYDHYYGTSARFIDRQLSEGKDILMDIDYKGARQILDRYPDSITIFIMPPSFEALKNRLVHRGTDCPKIIAKRLAAAEQEMANKKFYQHVVINDALPAAIQALTAIIAHPDAG